MEKKTQHPDQQPYALKVKNLRLKFPGEPSLLFKDLSFTVSRGEKVLLLGPSGSGKSTLLQVLSGLIPNSIEVPLMYDDILIPDSYGFVFQDPDTQFAMPYVDEELGFVLENLQVPRKEMDALIKQALKHVGLDAMEPHTQIHHLSQGMKQRLALASVLLLQPDVLFLDEPSALLDPEGTVQIWDAVKNVSDDKTVVIVEHKIDQIIDWVDRVVLFNHQGEIIANGIPTMIFEEHLEEINEFGIWYPNVWDDYVKSSRYKHLMTDRSTPKDRPVISLSHLKGYRGQDVKIHVREAAVRERSWVTIIGDNGAGKSTLLLSLMHLIRTSGTYQLYGETLDLETKKQEPPKQLSLVFQNPELQFVTQTVGDEIEFSLKLRGIEGQALTEKVDDLLKTFHLNVDHGHHPYQLSIGQKRRLSVATAFAHGAPILLLDEPTFGQDARNTFVMLEKLEELRQQGVTIVMVTHDMHIVNHFATDVWTIDEGELIDVEQIRQIESPIKNNRQDQNHNTPFKEVTP